MVDLERRDFLKKAVLGGVVLGILGLPGSASALSLGRKAEDGVKSHLLLSDIGTLNHATIDSYLDQAVKTSSSPTFVAATLSGLTQGSILFSGTGGLISQNNTNLFFDAVNHRLGLGTTSPLQRLHAVYNDQFVISNQTKNFNSATPSATGGYLANGTYYYVITMLDHAGGETTIGNEISATVSGGANTGLVTLAWTYSQGAVGYKIYRSTTSGVYTAASLLATLNYGSCQKYIDLGYSTTTGSPPATNTAYVMKINSAGTSNLSINTVGLTNAAQVFFNGGSWVNFDSINPTLVLNYGHGVSSGLYHGSYFRAYGSRGVDSPTAYSGNLHFNVTLPSQAAPTGVAGYIGSIANGTYYYTYVMYDRSAQRIKSAESSGIVVAAGGTGSVSITITASPLDSADYYELYRTTTAGTYSGTNYIGRIAGDRTTFTDTLMTPSAGSPATTTYSQYPRVMMWLRTEQPSSAAVKLYYDLRGNLMLSQADNCFAATTNTNTLALHLGTAPTAVNADYSYIYSADQAAGNNRIFILTEGTTDPMIIGKGYVYGSNAANGDLYLESTNNATRTSSTVYIGHSGGTTQIGDAVNYTEFLSDGTRVLHGTARATEQEQIRAPTVSKGASAPTELLVSIGASGGVMVPTLSFSKITQQDVYFEFHAPYSCDFTAPVYLHIVWHPGSGWTTGNYVWKLEYLVKNENDLLATGTPTTLSADVTPADATHFIETVFATGITLTQDDQLLICHFYRDVAVDTADDVGNVCMFEMNYTRNGDGANI